MVLIVVIKKEGRKTVDQKALRLGGGLEGSNSLKTEVVECWALHLFLLSGSGGQGRSKADPVSSWPLSPAH